MEILCEGVPSLDLANAGKIPASSGLVNQSEADLYSTGFDDLPLPARSERHYIKAEIKPTAVRSLILFWALDRGQMDLLHYLWTFDQHHPVTWGAKNLEFLLTLANDLASSDLEGVYPVEELFSTLLEPRPFATIMHSLPQMCDAMDFIEDHVVRNTVINHQLKLRLLYSHEMAPYAFLGSLSHLTLAL